MNQIVVYLYFIACISVASCTSSKNRLAASTNELSAARLNPFGRYDIDSGKSVELIGSAVHFGFTFTGKECKLYTNLPGANGHNYLQYTLDGEYQKRFVSTTHINPSHLRHLTVALTRFGFIKLPKRLPGRFIFKK